MGGYVTHEQYAEVESERDAAIALLHDIAGYTSEAGGWTEYGFPTTGNFAGKVAGKVHGMARLGVG